MHYQHNQAEMNQSRQKVASQGLRLELYWTSRRFTPQGLHSSWENAAKPDGDVCHNEANQFYCHKPNSLTNILKRAKILTSYKS